jgi:hypothetical protein
MAVSQRRREPATIEALMGSYLAELPAMRPDRDPAEADYSLQLLAAGLNGYGHQNLTRAEGERHRAAMSEGDDFAFCRLFGAKQIAKYLDEFFGYFLIRKTLLSAEDTADVVDDIRDFVGWLLRHGELTPAMARKALGRVAQASYELPTAERLSNLLFETAERNSARASRSEPPFDEVVEDFLIIERVAPGRIWFIGGVGPIKVPEAASAIARAGWTVNVVAGRRGSTWELLEVGNVYPETLA